MEGRTSLRCLHKVNVNIYIFYVYIVKIIYFLFLLFRVYSSGAFSRKLSHFVERAQSMTIYRVPVSYR